ncbi:hypothetical protein [Butyrivibrio sp. VCD2006]|uniref:hypothetical protein n=1 Tax=Butyrivibrio sp. VCD2006 TaxID=1280664 RepID=UPI000423D287|nr:hypothetical protein [Butyrivibrio sp. VCD2006]
MKKWNNPEISALDLNQTQNGIWPWDREVCVLILGGAHDATSSTNQPIEEGKGEGETTNTEDNVTNIDNLS